MSSGALTARVIAVTPTSITALTTNGTAPTARRNAAAVHLRNCYGPNLPCLVVFGGTTTGSDYLSGLYVLDLSKPSGNPTWSVPASTGTAPTGRHSGEWKLVTKTPLVLRTDWCVVQ